MTNLIYITGGINSSTTEKFLNDFNSINPDLDIVVYVNSPGGEIQESQIMLDVINNNSHNHNIHIVGCGILFSAAFNLFFGAKCKRTVLPGTLGMAHFFYASLSLNEGGVYINEYEKFLRTQMLKFKNQSLKRFKEIGLTDPELDIIKQGEDCYFTTERLNQLLKHGEIKS